MGQIQVGRDLRKFLAEPSTQRRVSYEIGPCCSELYPVGFSNPPRMERAQPLWAACSNICLSSSWSLIAFWKVYFKGVTLLAFLIPASPVTALALVTWERWTDPSDFRKGTKVFKVTEISRNIWWAPKELVVEGNQGSQEQELRRYLRTCLSGFC